MSQPLSNLVREEFTDIHLQRNIAWVRTANGLMEYVGKVDVDIPEIVKGNDSLEETEITTTLISSATGDKLRSRTAFRKSVSGPEVFMRLLPMFPPGIERTHADIITGCMRFPENGLYLVAGATGSGKSTFLASLLQHYINTCQIHVVTVEDPVEYILFNGKGNVSQHEIHSSQFHAGVKRSLREDPDIILIGEIRDPETAEAAVTASETGHAVFATVHAPGHAGAIDRMLSLLGNTDYGALRLSQVYANSTYITNDSGFRSCDSIWTSTAIRTIIRERRTHQFDANLTKNNARPELSPR